MQPNILFILADQLRRGTLGCYGMPEARTPNVDSLAAAGVRFSAACSSFPVCLPYRFTLMTGQRAMSRGVPCTDWRMSPAEPTIADAFNAGGYRTIYLGKWHLFGSGRASWVAPDHRGRFQFWEGWEARADNHFKTWSYLGPDSERRDYEGFQTDCMTDRAIELIAEHVATGNEQPFFMILSVEPPHPPYTAPPEYARQWDANFNLPPNFMFAGTDTGPEPKLRSEDLQRTLNGRRHYHAMIQNLDHNVGRLLGALERSGIASDTIVVLTSDHGQMDGAHSILQSTKRNPYEEAIGVPLIVMDPRRRQRAGAVVDEVVGTEDLFPTLLGLAGVPVPNGPAGVDCSPLIAGARSSLDRPGLMLYLTNHKDQDSVWFKKGWRALRTKDAMYACWGSRHGPMDPWHLYRLDEDPWQMNDLVKRDEPRRKALADMLSGLMADADDTAALV